MGKASDLRAEVASKELTFFSSGSLTVSDRLFKAFRIWLAATDVEVFSKACSSTVIMVSDRLRQLRVVTWRGAMHHGERPVTEGMRRLGGRRGIHRINDLAK